jgi:hypothetical protein
MEDDDAGFVKLFCTLAKLKEKKCETLMNGIEPMVTCLVDGHEVAAKLKLLCVEQLVGQSGNDIYISTTRWQVCMVNLMSTTVPFVPFAIFFETS